MRKSESGNKWKREERKKERKTDRKRKRERKREEEKGGKQKREAFASLPYEELLKNRAQDYIIKKAMCVVCFEAFCPLCRMMKGRGPQLLLRQIAKSTSQPSQACVTKTLSVSSDSIHIFTSQKKCTLCFILLLFLYNFLKIISVNYVKSFSVVWRMWKIKEGWSIIAKNEASNQSNRNLGCC